jgi:hypothetical protein
MSLFTSPQSTTSNHVEQILIKSPSEDLSQLLLKQFLAQNKSIIEGNQFLIEELRRLREIISKQNVLQKKKIIKNLYFFNLFFFFYLKG